MGDSYTAGPGAGTAWDEDPDPNDCYRSTGSYVPQLNTDFPFNGGNKYQFIACTGAKTPDVLDTQIELIVDDPPPDFAVLTLGGNDIGFSDILKACLLKPGGPISADCDDTLAASRVKLDSQDLQDNMFKVYDGIFGKMPAGYHYHVYHILYSAFFNADDASTWCNDQTFGLLPGYKPLLTLDLRTKLNRLGEDLNSRLAEIIEAYRKTKQPVDGPHAPGWVRNRIWSIDPDRERDSLNNAYGIFDKHRFCEIGVEDPAFNDPSTWFFGWRTDDVTMVGASNFSSVDTSTCASDPRYESDIVFSYQCDYAQYFKTPQAQSDLVVAAPESLTKSFHPRSVGFTALKRMLQNIMVDLRPAETRGLCAAGSNANGTDSDSVLTIDGAAPPIAPDPTCSTVDGSVSATSITAPTSTTVPAPPPATSAPPPPSSKPPAHPVPTPERPSPPNVGGGHSPNPN